MQSGIGPPMPKMPVTTLPETDADVRGLVSMMRGRQAELPEDMQPKVQAVLQKYGRQSTKDVHAAVSALDKARSDYEAAVLARNQQHRAWKKFLSDAFLLWQGYAAQFVEQEKQLQSQVAVHKEALVMAKADLEHAKLDHGEVHHVTSDEDFADGDPDLAAATSSASRIFRHHAGPRQFTPGTPKRSRLFGDGRCTCRKENSHCPTQTRRPRNG